MHPFITIGGTDTSLICIYQEDGKSDDTVAISPIITNRELRLSNHNNLPLESLFFNEMPCRSCRRTSKEKMSLGCRGLTIHSLWDNNVKQCLSVELATIIAIQFC